LSSQVSTKVKTLNYDATLTSWGPDYFDPGHCQASNKTTSLMRKHGAFCFVCYLAFCSSMAMRKARRERALTPRAAAPEGGSG
ncbi:hypothetical protein RF033_15035, partial [Serratia marcescens]|uniref:hypothetical protein n=1 Tax=Serratia marcescens TaxID=615 RepID=UPI00281331DF